jgi:hypothetical protein
MYVETGLHVNEIMYMKLVSLITVDSGILVNICLGSISVLLHIYLSLQCNSETISLWDHSPELMELMKVFQMFPKLGLSPGPLKV